MFSWTLVGLLVLISLPGILVTTPGLARGIVQTMAPKLPPDKPLPPLRVIALVMGVEVLVLVAGFAALGGLAAPQVGLSAPFFETLVFGGNAWQSFTSQILPMLVGGVAGGLVLVAGYYWIFRPWMDPQTVRSVENLRLKLGLAGRLLYGGILEEVLTRWGLMSVCAWLGLKLIGSATPAVIWGAILVSGVIFGLLHIPNYVLTGARLSPALVGMMLFLNLWASLVFGWLFWQVGLLAAIGAHMLFHLVWYPFDLRYAEAA